MTRDPTTDETTAARALVLSSLCAALVALGFAVPWWIENGASVYLSRLVEGFLLCL